MGTTSLGGGATKNISNFSTAQNESARKTKKSTREIIAKFSFLIWNFLLFTQKRFR